MVVLSTKLTTGEVTFISRLVIQFLAYVGIYFLERIVLGHAPPRAPLATHDLLNRFVGQSTATWSTLQWTWGRLVRNRDPTPSSALTVALLLALLYGITVNLSDVGLIGIRSCTVAGPSYDDFPASIQSDSDALALVRNHMLGGADPADVISYRCDDSTITNTSSTANSNTKIPINSCTILHNSTFGDGSTFWILNTTDSDILMPRNLAGSLDKPGMDMYLLTNAGDTVSTPTIEGGLAIIPHETGVQMIAGVPQLPQQTRVNMPKTLALEIEVGCLFLGITAAMGGVKQAVSYSVIPDEEYLPDQTSSQNYSGPDNLRPLLVKYAASLRSMMSDHPVDGGFDLLQDPLTWTLQLAPMGSSTLGSQMIDQIVSNCTSDVHNSTNIAAGLSPWASFPGRPSSCAVVLLRGSTIDGQKPSLRSDAMICATTTQFNMVSAILEVDVNGTASLNSLTRLPSDITTVQDTFGTELPVKGGSTANPSPLVRFTLSDNPSGQQQHFIYQALPSFPSLFSEGSSNIGSVFVNLASQIFSFQDPSMTVINSSYFSANFSAEQVTKWAGGVAASYILGSVGYNGWAARGSEALTVVSTGGYAAACYSPVYVLGFLPLLITAILVFSWAAFMGSTSRLSAANHFEHKYGGLAPQIDLPSPSLADLPASTLLEWVDEPGPHLRLVGEKEKDYDYGKT